MQNGQSELKVSKSVLKIVGVLMGAILMTNFSVPDANAKLVKRFKVNAWKGGVYTSNKTGEFSHCAASANYKSGITLFFSVTRTFNWQVGFAKPSWNMEIGKTYPVRYQVDRHKVFSGQARAATNKLAVIKLPAKAALFNQMRRGQVLYVKAGDDLLKFRLTSTKLLLSRLLRCAKRNKNLVANSSLSANSNLSGSDNPFESKTSPFSSNSGQPNTPKRKKTIVSAAYHQEARQWFQRTLANNGRTYRIVRNEGKAQNLYKKYAIVWRIGQKTGILGSMRIVATRKPSALSNQALANEARLCKGDFASRFLEDGEVSSRPIVRLMASCKLNNGKKWNVYYAISERERGGSYVVTLLSSKATGSAVLQAGEQISGNMQIASTTTSRTEIEEDDLPIRDEDEKVVTY